MIERLKGSMAYQKETCLRRRNLARREINSTKEMFHPSQSNIEEVVILEYLFVITKSDDVIFRILHLLSISLIFLNYFSLLISSFFFSILFFTHFFSIHPKITLFPNCFYNNLIIPIITILEKNHIPI